MTSFPWLTVIGAIPLAGALVIAIVPAASSGDSAGSGPPTPRSAGSGPAAPPKDARAARDLLSKQIALVASLVTLGLTVAMAVKFSPNGARFQFVQVYQWIPQFGVHYAVGVDGIALVLIGMTAVLMPVVILASWNDADPRPAAGAAASNGAAPAGSAGGVPPRYSVKTYFVCMLLLEAMVIGLFAATDVFLL